MTVSKYAAFAYDPRNPRRKDILLMSLDEMVYAVANSAGTIDPDTLKVSLMDEQELGSYRYTITYEHGDVDAATLDTRTIAVGIYEDLHA